MRDEYAEYLLERFGHLFSTFLTRGKYAKHQFSVADGWYALLFDLCAEINRIIDTADDHGRKVEVDVLQIKEKFGGLRFYKVTKVENESWFSTVFRKVDEWIKTKMCRIGWAKAYWAIHRWRRKHIYETIYEKVGSAVSRAEYKSHQICEVCGGEGRRVAPNGWMLVLCEKHEKEREEKD